MNTKDMFNVVQCLYNSIPVISSSQFFIFSLLFIIVVIICQCLILVPAQNSSISLILKQI